MPRQLDYFDFDPAARLECPRCWRVATASSLMRVHDDHAGFECPCGTVIATVRFPSVEELRAAAVAGDRAAARELERRRLPS